MFNLVKTKTEKPIPRSKLDHIVSKVDSHLVIKNKPK